MRTFKHIVEDFRRLLNIVDENSQGATSRFCDLSFERPGPRILWSFITTLLVCIINSLRSTTISARNIITFFWFRLIFFPPLPSRSPVISVFFCSRPNYSRRTSAETLATQATLVIKEFLVANNVQALTCLLSSTYAHFSRLLRFKKAQWASFRSLIIFTLPTLMQYLPLLKEYHPLLIKLREVNN